jgi:hypothetical protein
MEGSVVTVPGAGVSGCNWPPATGVVGEAGSGAAERPPSIPSLEQPATPTAKARTAIVATRVMSNQSFLPHRDI